MNDLDAHLPAIARGDQEAFGAWLAGAEQTLRASLRSFAASVDVEAVIQESLLRIWQVAPQVQPDGRPNALLRFAVRSARNLAISEGRRSGRIGPADAEAFEAFIERIASIGPDLPDPLLRRLIQACLAALPAKPRQALLARLEAAGGEADRDTAARLGVQVNTFLQNFTRARKFLASCLADKGVDLEQERA